MALPEFSNGCKEHEFQMISIDGIVKEKRTRKKSRGGETELVYKLCRSW